jgi:hypothetical protein
VSYIHSADGFPASYSHVLYVTSFRHCNTNTRPHHLEHHPTRNFPEVNSTRHCICEDELLCSFISWDYRARERVRTTKSEISYCTLILRMSLNVRNDSAGTREIRRHVLGFTRSRNVENREQRCHRNKQRCVDEVSSGAYAFSKSECRSQGGVIA